MLRPTALLLLLCACAPTVPDPERPADTGAPVDTGPLAAALRLRG